MNHKFMKQSTFLKKKKKGTVRQQVKVLDAIQGTQMEGENGLPQVDLHTVTVAYTYPTHRKISTC